MLLELRKPAQRTRLLQIRIGEFADILREHADHVRAKRAGVDPSSCRACQHKREKQHRDNFSMIHVFTLETPDCTMPIRQCRSSVYSYDQMLRNGMPSAASSLVLAFRAFRRSSKILFAGEKFSNCKCAASFRSSALRGTKPTISLLWIPQP